MSNDLIQLVDSAAESNEPNQEPVTPKKVSLKTRLESIYGPSVDNETFKSEKGLLTKPVKSELAHPSQPSPRPRASMNFQRLSQSRDDVFGMMEPEVKTGQKSIPGSSLFVDSDIEMEEPDFEWPIKTETKQENLATSKSKSIRDLSAKTGDDVIVLADSDEEVREILATAKLNRPKKAGMKFEKAADQDVINLISSGISTTI